MTSMATAIVEPPATEDTALPNKFVCPEFAGFAGEKRLKEILRQILPIALYRTWEIFADNQAYGNDCFMSVERAAAKVQRAEKTIQANLAELAAKKLLELRGERKILVKDGRIYSHPVVVKDFTGLYTLAREYDQWCQDDDYIEPDRAYAAMIKADPRLEAKLRRFNNYRRILYTQPTGPEAELSLEARWFQDYREDGEIERAEVENTRPNFPKKLPKKSPKQNPKTGQNESNERAYNNSQNGNSFDSARSREMGEEAGASSNTCSQNRAPVAGDYTKAGGERDFQNESTTNSVPPSHTNVPSGAGKTRGSEEDDPDVQRARAAMVAAGVTSGRSARRQTEKLLPPPKHPLARSFVHEVAGLFGDLNEKGSKTGIERSIEAFALASDEVLLCLVRAYVVARDTKAEKVRHRRPDGSANRMPLFCSMFKTFARAMGPGSTWQYTWEQMLGDIAADDRLSLWVSEHQAELAGDVSDQAETSGESPSVLPEATMEAPAGAEASLPEVPDEGWERQEEVYGCADYLAGELAANNYEGVVIQVKMPEGGTRLQILVFPQQGLGYRLVCEEDVAAVIDMACNGTLFNDSDVGD